MERELVPSLDQGSFVAAAQEQGLDLRVYLDVLRRRYLFFIIPALVVFAAVAVVTLFVLQPVYEASAKILVQSQLIPKDLAASTVTASAAERIQIIEQHLTTRDNLLAIAKKFRLYPEQSATASPSQIVDRIRGATKIEQILLDPDRVQRGSDALGFVLSFDYYDPAVASKVANELVASILEQNIRARNARAEETSKFFSQQLSKLEQDLAAQGQRIAEFKKANEGMLPETLADRRLRLAQLQMQLAALDQSLALGTGVPNTVETTEQIKGLNAQLNAAQVQLKNSTEKRAKLETLFQKGYVAKTQLLDLDSQIAAQQANVETLKSQIATAQQKLDELGAGSPDLLPKRRADLAAQVAALQQGIAKTPEVEATLNGLTRDYENMRAEYTLAKSKTMAATTGQEMEEDRQAERFEVLEQAIPPDKPIEPNRPRLLLAGALGSVAVGIGLVILLETMDKSIRSTADLERHLQIRPLVIIPYVLTNAERRRHKRHLKTVLTSLVLLLGLTIVVVQQFYFPFDVLAKHLLQQLGL